MRLTSVMQASRGTAAARAGRLRQARACGQQCVDTAPRVGAGLAHNFAHIRVDRDEPMAARSRGPAAQRPVATGQAPTSVQRQPAATPECPPRQPGETAESAKSSLQLIERSPKQEWLIYGFPVGSGDIGADQSGPARLMSRIVTRLGEGHLVYSVGQDPVELLAYSDCAEDIKGGQLLREQRASRFYATLQATFETESPRSFARFIQTAKAAPATPYLASNASKEGRSQNRGILVRRVAQPVQTKRLPGTDYDAEYGPTVSNCARYLSTEQILSRAYAHNAYCACSNTPDEPHNNCVRSCLQSKLFDFLSPNLQALREGRIGPLTWCSTIWKHHRECYTECGCKHPFIGFEFFSVLCTETFPCPSVGVSIGALNACTEPPTAP
jgi:hypothetical protein